MELSVLLKLPRQWIAHREEGLWQEMGQMMDLAIKKNQLYGLELPPSVDVIEAEARKRVEGTTTSPDPQR
jgi:hypothetical protein